MQLRYVKSGRAYLPEFNTNGEWIRFTKDTFPRESILGRLAIALAKLDKRGYYDGYYFQDEPYYIFFLEEHLVMAFLGACKSYYSEKVEEFNL